jgi:hypothetical protein
MPRIAFNHEGNANPFFKLPFQGYLFMIDTLFCGISTFFPQISLVVEVAEKRRLRETSITAESGNDRQRLLPYTLNLLCCGPVTCSPFSRSIFLF